MLTWIPNLLALLFFAFAVFIVVRDRRHTSVLTTPVKVPVFDMMAAYDWDAIWYLSPLNNSGPIAMRENRAKPAFFVGFWTGPQMDLVCVKKCHTNEEANRYLSPESDTLYGAALASESLLLRLREKDASREYYNTSMAFRAAERTPIELTNIRSRGVQ